MKKYDVDSLRDGIDLAQFIGKYVEVKRRGKEYIALCPFHTEKTPSLTVGVHNGKQRFRCWGCGENGDVFAFYAKMHGLDVKADFPKICKALSNGSAGDPIPEAALKKPPPRITCPVPMGSPFVNIDLMMRSGAEPVRACPYLTPESGLLGYVAWYPGEEGPRYWSYGSRSEADPKRWEPLPFSTPRPLYGLEQLARKPDAQVIVVEDEPNADAAAQLFPDFACISWPGGRWGVDEVDFSPLSGRSLVLIPIADDAGRQTMRRAVPHMVAAGARQIKGVDVDLIPVDGSGGADVEAPAGWTLQDAVAAGWTPETALDWARKNAEIYYPKSSDLSDLSDSPDSPDSPDLPVPAPEAEALSEAGAALPPPPAPAPTPPEAGTHAAEQQAPTEVPTEAPPERAPSPAVAEALASVATSATGKTRQAPPEPPNEPPGEGELGVVEGNTVRKPKRKLEVDPEDIRPEGWTDDDLADKWSAAHVDAWRYTPKWGMWHRWNGSIWEDDELKSIHYQARLFFRKLLANAPAETLTKKNRKEIMNDGHTTSILKYASRDPRHATKAALWDADLMLLGTPGGVVDLSTGKLIESKKSQLISRSTAVAPVEGPHPLFDKVIGRAGKDDPDMLAYLWRWLGYILTGSTKAEAMIFIHGQAGSGKGTFIKVIADILNDYSKTINIHAFLETKFQRHPQEIAKLEGARFVYASETAENMRLDEAKIKWLTGRDKIVAREMSKGDEEFYPQFKLLIYGNEKPMLKGVDEGIRRRLHMIEYPGALAAEDRDESLKDKLKEEYPAILHSMIRGCIAWQDAGGLGLPEQVAAATDKYLTQNDVLGEFFEECVERDDGGFEKSSAVYARFRDFSHERGQKYIMSQGILTQKIEARGFELTRTNRDGRIIRGLRLIGGHSAPPPMDYLDV